MDVQVAQARAPRPSVSACVRLLPTCPPLRLPALSTLRKHNALSEGQLAHGMHGDY